MWNPFDHEETARRLGMLWDRPVSTHHGNIAIHVVPLLMLELLCLCAKIDHKRKAKQQELAATLTEGVEINAAGHIDEESNLPAGRQGDRDVPQKFDTLSLEVFRFIGIWFVVLCHEGFKRPFTGALHDYADCGHWWPSFFFVLSGYILYSANIHKTSIDFFPFILRRVISTYPAYFCAAVLGLLFHPQPLEAAKWYTYKRQLPGFLMMDTWAQPYGFANPPDPNSPWAPNGPSWFVCSLVPMWFGFPRWFFLIKHNEFPFVALFVAWACTGLYPHFLPSGKLLKYSPWSWWPAFLCGMALARVAPILAQSKYARLLSRIIPSLTCCGVYYIFTYHQPFRTGSPWMSLAFKGFLLCPVWAGLLVFLPMGKDPILRHEILTSSPVLWMGEVSYFLYIFHWPVREALENVFGTVSLQKTLIAQFLFAVAFHEVVKPLVSRRTGKPSPPLINSGAMSKLRTAISRWAGS